MNGPVYTFQFRRLFVFRRVGHVLDWTEWISVGPKRVCGSLTSDVQQKDGSTSYFFGRLPTISMLFILAVI